MMGIKKITSGVLLVCIALVMMSEDLGMNVRAADVDGDGFEDEQINGMNADPDGPM